MAGSNIVANHGFEVDTTGWASGNSTITRVTSEALAGVASGEWEVTSVASTPSLRTEPRLAVSPGRLYRASAWVKGEVGRPYRPQIRFFDAGGTGGALMIGNGIVATGEWQRLTIGRTASADAATLQFLLRAEIPAAQVGDIALVDAVSVVDAPMRGLMLPR